MALIFYVKAKVVDSRGVERIVETGFRAPAEMSNHEKGEAYKEVLDFMKRDQKIPLLGAFNTWLYKTKGHLFRARTMKDIEVIWVNITYHNVPRIFPRMNMYRGRHSWL